MSGAVRSTTEVTSNDPMSGLAKTAAISTASRAVDSSRGSAASV
jgi:hypothetical protein